MAVKISNTTVIADDFQLLNVADTIGKYTDLHAVATDTTNNINFTTTMMTCTMTQNTTFTESGGAAGLTATLLLDTTSSSYTPTFSSNVNWENNTTPTWGDFQHWHITFFYADSNDIRAAAVGYTDITPSESVTLHGTSSSPENSFITSMPPTADCIYGYQFTSDGNIKRYTNGSVFGNTGLWTWSTSKWNNITPSQTYYIRFTNHDTSNGPGLDSSQSAPLNTWNALTSSRYARYDVAGPRNTVPTFNSVFKVEIASDSNGSNIVATGYYECEINGTA